MTIDEIRELIKVVSETGIAELELQRGEDRVRIRRSARGPVREILIPAETAALPVATPATEPGSAAPAPAQAAKAGEAAVDTSLIMIRSPIVGTFYEAAAPDAPPFVKIGETVHPGKVVCIFESMKLMNEIEAEFTGVIESRLVPNGQPVEYGEALFAVRPL